MRLLLVSPLIFLSGFFLIFSIFGPSKKIDDVVLYFIFGIGFLLLAYRVFKAKALKPSPKVIIAYAIYTFAYFIFAAAILMAIKGDVSASIISIMISLLIGYGGHRVHRREYLFISPEREAKMQQQTIEAGERIKETSLAVVEKLQVASAKREEERNKQQQFLNDLKSKCKHEPIVVVVTGGCGWDLRPNEPLLLTCREHSLHLSKVQTQTDLAIDFSELTEIEISGPGKVTTNAGVIGGGFGEGAIAGILVASVINTLTTSSTTNTYLNIGTRLAEVLLHIKALGPKELRALLSPAIVAYRGKRDEFMTGKASGKSISEEIERLQMMRAAGTLSEDEFAKAKHLVLVGQKADSAS